MIHCLEYYLVENWDSLYTCLKKKLWEVVSTTVSEHNSVGNQDNKKQSNSCDKKHVYPNVKDSRKNSAEKIF